MTNHFESIIQAKDKKIEELSELVHFYNSEILDYKKKVEEITIELKEKNDILLSQKSRGNSDQKFYPILSFFSQATFLDRDIENEQEINIIGHFTFQNMSETTYLEPIVCFRIKPLTNIHFGGKITVNALDNLEASRPSLSEEWIYVQKDWKEWVKEKGEHWLRPLHLPELKPHQAGKFTNFNITIKPTDVYSHYLIEGFFFARNEKVGIAAINTISIYS